MDIKKIVDSLSPNEIKILPYIKEKNINEICKKSNLDKTSVLRALDFLQNKKILGLEHQKKKMVEIGLNGALYRKKGLPERRLLNALNEKMIIPLKEAQKLATLSGDEFKASLGSLKKKALIELKNGKIILNANKQEISKKSPEEMFLESLPLEYDSLSPEQRFSLKNLENRKEIIEIKIETTISITPTPLGEEILSAKIKPTELIEQITPSLLKKESSWKNKKFRRYDITSKVPEISGGKRHFVNQSTDYARKIWTDMGFKEMTGNFVQSSFWNFDALFTAQDHPVREMQDTFFISNIVQKNDLPDKKLVKTVKDSHEKGVEESKGWQYQWNEEDSKKLVLRTHTTCLSARTLSNLKKEDLPKKFFSIGKCFRNETVDWSHGFEFNQTEGIVIDENANFQHLLGYLKQFAEKMGLKKIRFRPAYFPYTEPSVEGDAWDEKRQEWVELFAAGMLRPEVVVPLLGKKVPVLAWGPGIDRMIMKILEITDMRELYKNDLNQLRKIKFLMK